MKLHPRAARTLIAAIVGCTLATTLPTAMARDVEYTLLMDEVLRMPAAQRELDGSVRFYLSGQDHAPTVLRHSEAIVRGNIRGAGEHEIESCKRAALKALVTYQEQARKMGANAVVDIVSYFKNVPYMSRSQYECHAGSSTVVVVFKGSYAKIQY
ncbi:phosphoribosylglycinamide formyltransferase [soil metagenome]